VSTWPADELEARRWSIAVGVSQLLEEPTRWRHRRTERFEIRSAEEIRRHVSIDFTVPRPLWRYLQLRPDPDSGDAAASGRDAEWVVPLGWLARGPLVGFDLRQDDLSLPLLLASEIAQVTRDLLELELHLALKSAAEPSLGGAAAELIDAAVAMDVPDGALAEIDAFERRFGAPAAPLAALLRVSASGYLLLVLVPRVDRRQLVKFAFDEPVPDEGPRRGFFLQTPGVLDAASSHFESPLPAELRSTRWDLADDRYFDTLTPGPVYSHHPAFYTTSDTVEDALEAVRAARHDEPGTPGLAAQLRVERWRLHTPALLLALLAVASLVYGSWIADLEHVRDRSEHGTVVTLLLAGVALFIGLLLRLDEHSFARRLLAPARYALLTVLLAVLLAASALAFGGAHVLDLWRGASVAAGAATLVLAYELWASGVPLRRR
jgi:hypothetical protein